MLCTDALTGNTANKSYNIKDITVDIIAEIQKDLTPHDLTSLVFLLYDVPETALQRITLLQRVTRDVPRQDLDLLGDWARHKQNHPTWRYEFLEALVTCQLYGVIRKLGFDVATVKASYRKANPLNANYIHPMKMALYNLCEHLNSENVRKLKLALGTYNVNNVSECNSCELIFLHLMCQNFIAVGVEESNVLKLIEIIENIPGLLACAEKLRNIEVNLSKQKPHRFSAPTALSYQSTPKIQLRNYTHENETEVIKPVIETFGGSFEDTFENLADLVGKNLTITNLKTDATELSTDSYEIKNPQRIGVCCIINQEYFHPSNESITNKTCKEPLDDRIGSTRDKLTLIYTMEKLNFHVEATDNMEHHNLLPFIKNIIENKVQADDSMFVLCILSHGIEGHVYGVDSVPVKVLDIQDLLDSEDARILRGKPKILIIQACQVTSGKPALMLVSDGPRKQLEGTWKSKYFLRKSDFLICWATAPEYAAWRDEKKGSVFIQILCTVMYKQAKHEHMFDIFTKVANTVANICAQNNCAQIPEVISRLRYKLYLCAPAN